MQKRLLSGLIAGMVLVFVLSIAPVVTLAEEGEDANTISAPAEDKPRGEALKQQLQELKEQRQENRQLRLEANKLRACQNRSQRIEAILRRSIIRAERQLTLFTTIAERVKAFYVDKGYSLENYDALVAAVDAAKAEAQANLEVLKEIEPFDCEAEDPKGNIEAFKLALHSINQDLKDYRTSVKDLIVGVKSAQNQGDAGSEEGGDEQ